jgi:GNAT superfamily N-acetyltransferase
MSVIEYRVGKPDVHEFFKLFETTGWNDEYEATVADINKILDNSWYIVSAYENEQLVGSGRMITDGLLHAMIFDMIVLPSHQGRGIGAAILKKLVDKCRENHIRDVQLFCARGKAGFYAKNGFEARPEDAPGMSLKKFF